MTYPSVELNPYATGIKCSYCGVDADQRCRTSGDNLFGGLCHQVREDDAREQGVELVTHNKEAPSRIARVKIALWYVEKVGGVEEARSLLDAVAKLLGE